MLQEFAIRYSIPPNGCKVSTRMQLDQSRRNSFQRFWATERTVFRDQLVCLLCIQYSACRAFKRLHCATVRRLQGNMALEATEMETSLKVRRRSCLVLLRLKASTPGHASVGLRCSAFLQVIVVGNGQVGKTSMLTRFAKGVMTESYKKTIGTGVCVCV